VSEPVREAVNLMPAEFFYGFRRNSFAVEESIQMGDVLRAKTRRGFRPKIFLDPDSPAASVIFSVR